MAHGTLPPLTRRRFLRGAATVGAGATAAALFPGLVERAYAAADPAGCGSLADIEHFVFVMQENRSFDHYFGTLSGVRGFDDASVLQQTVGDIDHRRRASQGRGAPGGVRRGGDAMGFDEHAGRAEPASRPPAANRSRRAGMAASPPDRSAAWQPGAAAGPP